MYYVSTFVINDLVHKLQINRYARDYVIGAIICEEGDATELIPQAVVLEHTGCVSRGH